MNLSIGIKDVAGSAALPQSQIGETVRRSRQDMGYSIDDLAVTCGLTGAEISRIEIGADIDPARLRRVANALRLPVERLTGA
ncbi:helix-turn-helix domain-containing protein [Ensifer soli]|uniref:helix-turn-helix domain-containing protein n=1 Tax=Ciceribacter sp. sgz301302 TaxID=3342379 RepID=UPI0035B7A262